MHSEEEAFESSARFSKSAEERADGGGVLQGLRVVEFSGIGPAPFCAMLLADMGAEVVRIESPVSRRNGIALERRFDLLNRGRRSVVLDLKSPSGLKAARELVRDADILLEGFRPGVMERLGLGPDTAHRSNPRLVYGRMTGFGQDGPMAHVAGHDLNYIALSGVLGSLGPRESAPTPPLNLIGDFGGGGMLLTVGVLAAYVHARATGRGQIVDAAMVDGAALLMTSIHALRAAGQWSDERGANVLDGGAPWYAVYETADKRYLSIAAIEPRFFEAFLARSKLDPDLISIQNDRPHWPRLRTLIADRIREHPLEYWCEVFAGSDCCVAPVLTLDEAADHPHSLARGSYVVVDGVRQPAPAPRFSATPSRIGSPST